MDPDHFDDSPYLDVDDTPEFRRELLHASPAPTSGFRLPASSRRWGGHRRGAGAHDLLDCFRTNINDVPTWAARILARHASQPDEGPHPTTGAER
jgi:hypothetical protein